MKIIKTTNLYRRYPGQTEPQPCYVEIDCRLQTLSADYNSEIGNAIPLSVWHGHCQRFAIPILRTVSADELLAEIQPLAERVINGYESIWDGSNHIAQYNANALDALDQIKEICNHVGEDVGEDGLLQVMDIGDYWEGSIASYDEGGHTVKIDGIGAVTPSTTDEEIEAMAEAMAEEMETVSEWHIDGDVEEYLNSIRDYVRENKGKR